MLTFCQLCRLPIDCRFIETITRRFVNIDFAEQRSIVLCKWWMYEWSNETDNSNNKIAQTQTGGSEEIKENGNVVCALCSVEASYVRIITKKGIKKQPQQMWWYAMASAKRMQIFDGNKLLALFIAQFTSLFSRRFSFVSPEWGNYNIISLYHYHSLLFSILKDNTKFWRVHKCDPQCCRPYFLFFVQPIGWLLLGRSTETRTWIDEMQWMHLNVALLK